MAQLQLWDILLQNRTINAQTLTFSLGKKLLLSNLFAVSALKKGTEVIARWDGQALVPEGSETVHEWHLDERLHDHSPTWWKYWSRELIHNSWLDLFLFLLSFVSFLTAVCGWFDCVAARWVATERLWIGVWYFPVYCYQHLWNHCLESFQSHYHQHWQRYVCSYSQSPHVSLGVYYT